MNKEKTPQKKELLFKKKNYIILIVAICIIMLGFALMVGGGSKDPTFFNPDIFNFRRIRIAPTIVLIGFAVVIFSIFYKEKK